MRKTTKIALAVGAALSLGLAAAELTAHPSDGGYGMGSGAGMGYGMQGYGMHGYGMGPGAGMGYGMHGGGMGFGAYPGAAENRLADLKSQLGITVGGTTGDGLFTLEEMQCLAACGGAPCLQVNYRYFENVTTERVDAILAALRSGQAPEGQDVPPHGTLSRVTLPVPQTPADRERPEEIH